MTYGVSDRVARRTGVRAAGVDEVCATTGTRWKLLASFAVLAFGLCITYGVFHMYLDADYKAADIRFAQLENKAVQQLHARLRAYEHMLVGAGALATVRRSLTRAEWRAYVISLHLSENYPGVLGLGYDPIVRPEELGAHVAAARGEGAIAYAVWPQGLRTEYSPILYIEPFTTDNERALGYDMYSHPVRREAMDRARQTGHAALSGKVSLVQDGPGKWQAGVLMYLPVYRTDTAASGTRVHAYVHAAFRMNEFMGRLWKDELSTVRLELYDGRAAPESLLYVNGVPAATGAAAGRYTRETTLRLYGRPLVVRVQASPEFVGGAFGVNAAWPVVLGLVCTALFATLAWMLVENRLAVRQLRSLNRAQREAAHMLKMAEAVARFGGWNVELPSSRVTWSTGVREIHEVDSDYQPTLEDGFNFYIPESRQLIGSRFKECAESGTPYDLELELVTATGRRIWVRAIGEAVRDEAGRIVLVQGACQDITARKHAEQENKRLADRLLTVLESIPEAFFMLDHQWRFSYINHEAERLLRRKRDTLIGTVVWEQYPDAIGTDFERQYRLAIETGSPVSFVTYYSPLQFWCEVHAYPSPDGLAVYFRDVTARKAAEEKIREQAALLDRATDAIIVRGLDHRLRYCNKAAEQLYGWNGGTVIGRSVEELLYGRDPRSYQEAMKHVLRSGEWSGRIMQQRLDGTPVTVQGHWTLVRDAQGRPDAVLAINTDLGDRMALEERLAQAQRLESLGQLTGGVAHDFNNLLTAILGNADLLNEELAHDPLLQEKAATIVSAAESGAQLTGQLLTFARKQSLQPQVVDIPQVIARVRALLLHALGHAIELTIVEQPDLWPAYLDPVQLESAVLNLCLNARDAMPNGGRLTLELTNVTSCEAAAPCANEEGAAEYVQLTVADTGCGMSPEVIARAFEPFFTTKAKGKGTGLGLSTVYGFVRQSGGYVDLSSTPGIGTRVRLCFPRASAADARQVVAHEAQEMAPGHEAVLVVEDEDMVRAHACEVLRRLGYLVTEARDGREALEMLRSGHPCDVLFTDVRMPGMSGIELAKMALRERGHLAVLYTSAIADENWREESAGCGETCFLRKPYRAETLARKLREALDAAPSRGRGDGQCRGHIGC